VLLRGSASAYRSNTALVEVLAAPPRRPACRAMRCSFVPGTDRSSVGELLHARGLVDLVHPAGGAGLINYVVETPPCR